jgi:hypothetical protein
MKKLLIYLFIYLFVCLFDNRGYLETEGERWLDTRLFESAWLRTKKH